MKRNSIRGAAVAALLLLAAGAFPAVPAASGITIEREDGRTEIPVIENGGGRWVRVVAALKAALGPAVTSYGFAPRMRIAVPGGTLFLAAGLRQVVWAPDGGTAQAVSWMSDPLRIIEGAPCVSPRSLPALLTGTGTDNSWTDGGKRLAVKTRYESPAVEAPAPAPEEPRLRPGAAPRRPRTGPFHIVIDAGHGGADCGARGRSRACEKEITLDLALRIKRLLANRKMKVTTTRDSDRYVSLQKRVKITRAARPDLFLSIHVNAARNRSAKGVETYVYGDRPLSRDRKALVAAENADAPYLDIIVSDMEQRQHHGASVEAAGAVEDEMIRSLNLIGRAGKRIFEAPFYVLARSRCPAVLIEVGFISNRTEERKLRSRDYRQKLAEAITSGVLKVAR